MNDSKQNLRRRETKQPDSKQHWRASSPYPTWPFGTVPAKELEKYARQQARSRAKQPGFCEEAPF